MDRPYVSPLSNPGDSDGSGRVSARTAEIMARTKGWVRFIAVVLFVNFGISIISTLVSLGSENRLASGPSGLGRFFGMGVMLLLYLYPAVKLNSYASRIGVLLQSGLPRDLEAALNEHRAFWRYLGIVAIVLLSIGVLGVVFGFASAVSG